MEDILKQEVPEGNKISIDEGESWFIPIKTLEDMLDQFDYSTRNFQYTIFKDGYAKLCVAASLELIINYKPKPFDEQIQRVFVGACNFPLQSLGVNQHFLATAKSECMKNAASDIGRYFGRWINPKDYSPNTKGTNLIQTVKSKPDSKIMQQFNDAVILGDEAAITMLTNIYDIKTD